MRISILALLLFPTFVNAQPSPWETVAPPGSFIYADIKSAAKEASSAYRLHIEGGLILNDKKQLGKIASLTSLMALRLDNNGISQLPSAFLGCHALVYFSSTGNALTNLPDSLGMWNSLKFLELQQTSFDTIPEGIYGLPRLNSFMLNGNTDTICFTSSVKMFPKCFTELRIYNTLVDTLPEEFAQLSQLSKLVMYKCKLYDIPQQIFPLTGLSELWLDSNNLTVVPPSIAQMQGLTYLSLRGNRITKVTSSICFLKNLVVLDLRGNPMDPYDVQVVQALLPNCRVLF